MTDNVQIKFYEISIDLITGILNTLKLSPDFWGSEGKQAQYTHLQEYRGYLVTTMQLKSGFMVERS